MAVGTAILIGAGASAAIKGVNAGINRKNAKNAEKKAGQESADAKLAMSELLANRQEIINPAEGMTNEFDNLSVSTQAAQFEAEEADIALANTLDTIAATGGGAGGATALAQAALQSKRGISASIEKQESSNNAARAQGAANVSQALAEGEAFKFNATEAREDAELNRKQVEINNAQSLENQARQAKQQSTANMLGAVGDFAGSVTAPGSMVGGNKGFTSWK